MRCNATNQRNGEQCKQQAIIGTYCLQHWKTINKLFPNKEERQKEKQRKQERIKTKITTNYTHI